MLRPLGAYEKLFWLLDQTRSVHFAMAAEIEGRVPVQKWEESLDALQQRHPMLSVCIRENSPLQPAFYRVEGRRIPLRVIQDENESRLDRELEAELASPFDFSVAPLIRVVLIESATRSTIIIAIHHSIGDGISVSYLIRDLLQAASGKWLEPLSLPSSREALLEMAPATAGIQGAGTDMKDLSLPPGTPGVSAEVYRVKEAPPKVRRFRLSAELTDKLLFRCRQEGTTIHGALCAAFVFAGTRQITGWQQRPVRLMSPVSIRKALAIQDDVGVYITTHRLTVDPNGITSFWDLARLAKSQLAATGNRQAIQKHFERVQELADNGAGVLRMNEIRLEGFGNDLTLSNIGAVLYDARFGALRLESVWGPLVFSGIDEQYMAGVTTTNGSLSILLGSREPLGHLLETVSQVLNVASMGELIPL
jgi:hypothetical protein